MQREQEERTYLVPTHTPLPLPPLTPYQGTHLLKQKEISVVRVNRMGPLGLKERLWKQAHTLR